MTLQSLSMIQTAFKTCVAPSLNHACAGLLVFLCISSTCAAALHLFPTCQVRVVRFYVTLLLLLFLVLLPSSPRLLLRIESEHPRPVFPAGLQPPAATASVPYRTSTASSHGSQPATSVPFNCDHRRPVFPAGPQPRPSAASVPCRTSTDRKKVRKSADPVRRAQSSFLM